MRKAIFFILLLLTSVSAGAATYNVKTYGAAGNGTTDDTAAIQSAAAALQTAGGGTLFFPPGTYKIFSSGTTWSNFTLAYFHDISGINVLSEGATIATDPAQTFAFGGGVASGMMFGFSNCTDILVDGFIVTGPTMTVTQTNSYGMNFVLLYPGNLNVRIPNNKVSGCLAAVNIIRDPAYDQPKTLNVWIGNLDVSNSFYAINSNYSPDNLTAEHVTTVGVTRAYVTYGTRNHRVKLISHGSYSYDCVIGTAGVYPTEGIDLDYTSGTDYSASSTEHAHVRLSFASSSSYLRNIKIHFNIEYGSTTGGGPALRFVKDADVAQRLDGLTISGYIKGVPNSTYGDPNGPIIGSSDSSPWSTSDHFSNISLRDLRLDSSKYVRFLLPGLTGPFSIDDVHSDTSVQLRQSSSDSAPPSTGSYSIVASQFSNRDTYVSGESAQPLELILGGGNRTIPTGWSGHSVVNTGNSTATAWTLPAAVPGLEYTFIRSATPDIYLVPASGEVIRGGGAGKYLRLGSAGGTVRLRCAVAGTWEILSSYGSLVYEP